jgi:hypothetical protein
LYYCIYGFTSVLPEQMEAQIISHHWHILDHAQYTFLQNYSKIIHFSPNSKCKKFFIKVLSKCWKCHLRDPNFTNFLGDHGSQPRPRLEMCCLTHDDQSTLPTMIFAQKDKQTTMECVKYTVVTSASA